MDGNGKTIRQEIRDWWRPLIDAGDPFEPKVEAQRCVAELGQNPDLVRRWFQETAYDTAYAVGMGLVSRGRTTVMREAMSAGEAKASLKEQLERDPVDFSRWMERDPNTGVQVPLVEMVKEQVLAAAEVRGKRGMEELKREAMLRFVAGRLQPGQRVGDVWSDDLLADLAQRIEVKAKTALRGIDKKRPPQSLAAD